MCRAHYEIPQTNHFDVDSVLNCEEDEVGDYFHTIQMSDVATVFCGIQVLFGRSYRVMQYGFEWIQQICRPLLLKYLRIMELNFPTNICFGFGNTVVGHCCPPSVSRSFDWPNTK